MNNNQNPPDSDNLPMPVVGYSFEQNEYISLLEGVVRALIMVDNSSNPYWPALRLAAKKLMSDNDLYWTDYEAWRKAIAEGKASR